MIKVYRTIKFDKVLLMRKENYQLLLTFDGHHEKLSIVIQTWRRYLNCGS